MNYAVNVPFDQGMTGMNYVRLFKIITSEVVRKYQPSVIVMQCGADSLNGDKLGSFNLSIKDHADCLLHVQKFKLPLMVLGGGGYTVQNVAKCWAYETACLLGREIED